MAGAPVAVKTSGVPGGVEEPPSVTVTVVVLACPALTVVGYRARVVADPRKLTAAVIGDESELAVKSASPW